MIDSEELRLVRKFMDACIAVSRAQREAEAADHELTMYRMEKAEPDAALTLARDYAKRRGFEDTVERIDALLENPDV